MKFVDHKYVWSRPFTAVHHTWSFRGPRGGIHLAVSIMDDPKSAPSCGLEFHHNYDPTGGQEPALDTNCWLLGGPCWHKGTSLYASETVWPRVQQMMPDHDAIFRYLETLYDDHFGDVEGAS